MTVKRLHAPSSSVLDVLERVLDRGIVIDAWVGVSVAGIRVVEIDTRVVVASLDTYLSRGRELSILATVTRPTWPARRLEGSAVPPGPEPAPDPEPPRRRRQRRRQLGAQPTSPTLQGPRLRCEKGCTFEWTQAGAPPASLACPYRKRTRCRVVAG